MIDTDDADTAIELEELIDQLESGDLDTEDEDNFASWGPALKRLANNRTFLGDLMIKELKQRCEGQLLGNQYTPQVMMLYSGGSRRFILRANFWPALTDSVVKHSGTEPFLYDVPHDHNFSFLTVGYLGPGYWSDYYEYDYDRVVGLPGEKVELKFVEKSRLELGKVMLYRAHKDIHLQLPPDALSVSINILELSPSAAFRDQYRFDVDRSEVHSILTRMSLEPLIAMAAKLGGENGRDLIQTFAASHPSDRIRWCATRAQAAAEESFDGKLQVLAAATADASLLVRGMARREIEKLKVTRAWIEAAPPEAARAA